MVSSGVNSMYDNGVRYTPASSVAVWDGSPKSSLVAYVTLTLMVGLLYASPATPQDTGIPWGAAVRVKLDTLPRDILMRDMAYFWWQIEDVLQYHFSQGDTLTILDTKGWKCKCPTTSMEVPESDILLWSVDTYLLWLLKYLRIHPPVNGWYVVAVEWTNGVSARFTYNHPAWNVSIYYEGWPSGEDWDFDLSKNWETVTVHTYKRDSKIYRGGPSMKIPFDARK